MIIIRQEALPILAGARTASDAADSLGASGHADLPRVLEARGYLYARDARIAEAAEMLETLVSSVEPWAPWVAACVAQARRFKDLLVHDPMEAQALLREWEGETIRNLGLDDFWAPHPN